MSDLMTKWETWGQAKVDKLDRRIEPCLQVATEVYELALPGLPIIIGAWIASIFIDRFDLPRTIRLSQAQNKPDTPQQRIQYHKGTVLIAQYAMKLVRSPNLQVAMEYFANKQSDVPIEIKNLIPPACDMKGTCGEGEFVLKSHEGSSLLCNGIGVGLAYLKLAEIICKLQNEEARTTMEVIFANCNRFLICSINAILNSPLQKTSQQAESLSN
jgi:hypothetical protein